MPGLSWAGGAEAVGEGGVAAACSAGADGLGEGAAGSGEDEEFLGAGHAGVEQVALQHHPGRGAERDDHRGIFAALRAVDCDGVGVGELVEFGEVVVHVLVFFGEHGEGLLLQRYAGDDADGAVEDSGLAFVVVVAQLGDLSPRRNTRPPYHFSGVPSCCGVRACCSRALRLPAPVGPRWVGVSTWTSRTGSSANLAGMRRATMSTTSLAVSSAGCRPEPAGGSQVNQKKSPKPASRGGWPRLMRWALTTMPDRRACRKTWVRRTRGMAPAASRSRSTSPAPTEGSWSMSPTSSRCAPAGMALTSLLARITSIIEASSATTRSASRGLSRSYRGSPPGCSSSSRWMVEASWPVSSASRLAARPVGATRTTVAFLAAASSTTERTVKLLPQPGPPVSTATLLVSASLTASCCSGARSWPDRLRSQPSALPQSTRANAGSRSFAAFSRPSSPSARERSARWNGTR